MGELYVIAKYSSKGCNAGHYKIQRTTLLVHNFVGVNSRYSQGIYNRVDWTKGKNATLYISITIDLRSGKEELMLCYTFYLV